MPETGYWGWVYPEENEDPHFDKLEAFFKNVDEGVFALLNTAGNVIVPPANLNWNNTTKTLSWTGYFEIPIISSGFSCKILFGPDGINPSVSFNDGERLIAVVQSTLSGNVNLNFQKVAGKVSVESGVMVIGFCRGDKFYANFPQEMTGTVVTGGIENHGTFVSPMSIDPAVGIVPTVAADQVWWVTPSSGGPGPVLITASPQVAAGTTVGQRLTIFGKTVGGAYFRIVDGNGVLQNGSFNLITEQCLTYFWNGTDWQFVANAI